MNPWRRVYRVRPWPATVLALPLVLLAAWYAWRAFASLDSYRRAADPDHELRLEEYQLALHDALRHDLRRFGMPGPPRRPRVPHLELHLSNANLAALEAGALLPEKRPYVKARLVRGGRREKIKLHLRGTQPWHWLNPQKSLKLKIDDDDAVAGRAFLRGKVLNLVNDPNPVPVADELVFRQARELGLLAPATGFARLKLNGSDLGVFRSSGQVDESVPRAARRFPGSMYSGNLSGKAPADRLWLEPESWKKVSWQPGQEATRADLARLLGALSRGSLAELSDLAAHELDLGRFAALEALEIAFGVDERDARQNHKLYLDPHSGRWEPVAWSLRGFRHRPELELAEHPLGLRLKLVPGYLSLRARALHGLLTGSGRPATVRRQALDLLEELWPELTSDPHWDATKLLPDTSAFLRRMPRFMDEERLTLALEAELATYADRHAFLRERFARLELVHALGQPREAPGGFETDWELWLDGQSGVRLSELTARFAPECAEPAWQVFARGAPLTALGRAAEQPVLAPLVLEPVARLVERPGGELRAVPAPTRYSLRVASRCAPLSVEACGARLDDGSRVRSSPRSPEAPALAAPVQPEPAHVPALAAGESGLHPWSLAPSAPEVVSLGPGEVPVEGQRVYARHQAVVIEPGTTLRLGPGASLIFLGTLEVRGSQESPVQVVASGGEPFGGLALQGPGTAGSRLSHLIVLGGDRPAWRSASYSAALEVQDTERIEIRDCKLRGATREGLHVGSVRGLTVDGLEVEDAAGDALDLEFTQGSLQRLRLLRAGDDGLDLMGGELSVSDAVVVGAAGNAVSAGEEVELALGSSLLASARTGLRVKNGARVTCSGSLVFEAETGLAVEGPTPYYPLLPRLLADDLGLVAVKEESHLSRRVARRVELSRVFRTLSDAGGLARLRREVLGLADWGGLEALVQGWRARVTP